MNLDAAFDAQKLGWLVGVHLVFVISTLVLALSDRWGAIIRANSEWRVASEVSAIRHSLFAHFLPHAVKFLRGLVEHE